MIVLLQLVALSVVMVSVQSLEPKPEKGDVFEKIIDLLSKKPTRRLVNMDTLNKARSRYKDLTKNMNNEQIKQFLRASGGKDEGDENAADPGDKLAEEELKNSLNQKKSALLDRPYVESEGKRDFLVIAPDVFDQFVTVIPNAIYQRIEKKCVNWLDDCSLKGIRTRLLQGVRSPFR